MPIDNTLKNNTQGLRHVSGAILRSKRKFTLIELLVVIAILSVLASLLLPALNRAKTHAKQARCITNMKQLYVGANLYTMDNRDRFPVGNPVGTYGFTEDYGLLKSRAQSQVIAPLWGGERKVGPCTIPTSIKHAHPSGNVNWFQWEDDNAYMGSMSVFGCPETLGWESSTGTYARDFVELAWMGKYDFWLNPNRLNKFGGSPLKLSTSNGEWWLSSEVVREEENYTKPYHFDMQFNVLHMDGHVDRHRVQSYYALPQPTSGMHNDDFSL